MGIIQQLEGHIEVESKAGAGTTFTIYLPAIKPPSEATGSMSASDLEEETLRGKGETILLIEDEPTVRQVMKILLEHLNYNVIEAASAQEALERYNQNGAVSLVISDMMMPDMKGTDLLKHLQEKDPELKFILVTGYPFDMPQEEMEAHGVSDWVPKPVKGDVLASKIRKVLDAENQQDT